MGGPSLKQIATFKCSQLLSSFYRFIISILSSVDYVSRGYVVCLAHYLQDLCMIYLACHPTFDFFLLCKPDDIRNILLCTFIHHS